MSYLDVAIPGMVGLLGLVWPRLFFFGSRATPDEKKLRVIRFVGVFLLLVAVFNLAVKVLK